VLSVSDGLPGGLLDRRPGFAATGAILANLLLHEETCHRTRYRSGIKQNCSVVQKIGRFSDALTFSNSSS